MTNEQLGRIMITEVGKEELLLAYETLDPEMVGALALAYGDINKDGSLN